MTEPEDACRKPVRITDRRINHARMCQLEAGHEGQHRTTFCLAPYLWANTKEENN